MPWNESNLMSLRREFALQANNKEISFSELCKRYNITRPTGYKWLKRFNEDSSNSLADKSRKPNNNPNKTAEDIEKIILECRQKHKTWGGRKIHGFLVNTGVASPPAPSTISQILSRHGYIGIPRETPSSMCRFEHDNPNDLWQMDFKGHFAYGNGRCHPLTILDDCSRFSLTIDACDNERGDTVKPLLISTFERYGMPARINVDNGNPWGNAAHDCRHTSLSVWLLDLGIRMSYSRPYHPQTNGKIERFHRTLKQEVLSHQYFNDLNSIQIELNRWRNEYNQVRPHEAINNKVPADIYKPSYREYPSEICEYKYAEDYSRHYVDARGRVSLGGRVIFVGNAFCKKHIGVRYEADNNIVRLYYRHQKLGKVILSTITKGSMINLYSGNLLST